MAIDIRNTEAERLAREVARGTGERIPDAVIVSLRERLVRLQGQAAPRRLADELDEIALRCAALPRLDNRSEDEILGYDGEGIPR